jgi:hypothetical protein
MVHCLLSLMKCSGATMKTHLMLLKGAGLAGNKYDVATPKSKYVYLIIAERAGNKSSW